MAVTSGWFVGALVCLTVVGFVAAVVVMPRLRGRWWSVTARVVVLLVVNALVVTTAAANLNARYGWFASWQDLIGSTQQTGTETVSGAATARAASAQVAGPGFAAFPRRSGPLPPLAQPGTRLQTYTVPGRSSGATGEVQVYLPASYQAQAPRGRVYPVIVAFHGFPTGPEGWTRAMRLPEEIDAAVAAGSLAETVVVVPQINIPRRIDTECVDGPPGSPQMETWLTEDVTRFVLDRFAVRRDRTSWATMGYSLGAWCSAMISMLHPDLYAGSISLGGYYQPDFGSAYRPFAPYSRQWRRYDLVELARQRPPALAMWVQTGSADRFLASTQDFLRAARAPLSLTSLVLPEAGHRVDVWIPLLPDCLRWLGQSIPGFRPVRPTPQARHA